MVQKATANARPVAAHAHGAKGVIAAVQVGRIGMAELRSFWAPQDVWSYDVEFFCDGHVDLWIGRTGRI